MTKLLANKKFKFALGIILAFLLVVTLIPAIHTAYGEGEEQLINAATSAVDTEGASGLPEDSTSTDEGANDESDAATANEDGELEDAAEMSDEATEDAALSAQAERVGVAWTGNTATINDGTTVDVSVVTLPNGQGSYTLTVNGTLNGRIAVGANQTLNLKGHGTINGAAQDGSVITVKGKKATLILNEDMKSNAGAKGLTITGGKGTAVPHNFGGDHNTQIPLNAGDRAGGGIHVQRTSADSDTANNPRFIMYGGTITGNQAAAGGGIYIDRWCNFEMHGGTVSSNTATVHEGGGIYTAARAAKITAGNILNNETKTTTDWGGGGIFVESRGRLAIPTIKVAGNTAYGLGGGISGCPHARIGVAGQGIGDITEGAAIYGNTAHKTARPQNNVLYALEFRGSNNYVVGPPHTYEALKGKDVAGDLYAYADTLDGSQFTKEVAQDYYCTRSSIVFGQNLDGGSGLAWTGRYAGPDGSGDIKINKGAWYGEGNYTVGLTATAPASTQISRAVTVEGNTSSTHGGGIGCNGQLIIGSLPSQTIVNKLWTIEFEKNLKKYNDELITTNLPSFKFGLYSAKDENAKIAEATNTSDGKITFTVDDDRFAGSEGGTEYTLYAKEIRNDLQAEDYEFDESWHEVKVTIGKRTSVAEVDGEKVTTTSSYVKKIDYGTSGTPGQTFTNRVILKGDLALKAKKFLYGDTSNAAGKFFFTMQRITEPVDGVLDLNSAPLERMSRPGTNGGFTGNEAEVAFDAVSYTEIGDYWYLISENESSGTTHDPRIYVVKVTVRVAADGMSLVPSVAEISYAEGIEVDESGSPKPVTLTKLEPVDGALPDIEFTNFNDGIATMNVYGYAVNAASNEPIEQQCFVDPKIIKNLEGRALTEGEFNFKLIELTPTKNSDGVEVVDWSTTNGPTISETTNDRYGMVDFDKANNVGTWENPTCLQYTAPGTYYYRVVEANDTSDPSVEYSKQIITFTTVIELNEQGQLECTDMYYGHVENGENIRYNESEDPQWHPTMTNKTRGMDLQVRKTSALDRDKGLEGATYGLYAVNDHAQSDILLGEAISDADGWITFKSVDLTENTLYYFKERLAPAGHTVSEFRSSYFYLVKDINAPNGYEMKYADNKEDFTPEGDQAQLAVFTEGEVGTARAVAGPRSDDGALLFTFAKDGGVYDEATRVDFTKLDTRTHEWVEGAKLSIIEKDTSKVVNSWTSGQAPERLEGTLNVDTTYILREDEAPEGYAKANDVEFMIDQYGSVKLLSGTSNGNAELQDSTISLYDTMLDVEELVTQYRETPGQDEEGSFLAKTEDFLKIAGLIALMTVSFLGLVYAIRRFRKGHE